MPLRIQKLVAVLTHSDLAAVRHDAESRPGMLIAALADNHQIGDVQWGFLRQDPSLDVFLRVRPGVLLDMIQAFDHCPVFVLEDPEHFSSLAPVLPRQHVNHVVFLNMHSGHRILSSLNRF